MNIKIAQPYKYSSDQKPPPPLPFFSLSPSSYFKSLHLGLNLSWTQTNRFSQEIIHQHFNGSCMYNAKHCQAVASNCPFECLMFELINMI